MRKLLRIPLRRPFTVLGALSVTAWFVVTAGAVAPSGGWLLALKLALLPAYTMRVPIIGVWLVVAPGPPSWLAELFLAPLLLAPYLVADFGLARWRRSKSGSIVVVARPPQ